MAMGTEEEFTRELRRSARVNSLWIARHHGPYVSSQGDLLSRRTRILWVFSTSFNQQSFLYVSTRAKKDHHVSLDM